MVDCEGVSLGSSCAKLPHSHSAEISKTPPPGGPKNAGKMLALRVVMLDDNITLFQVQAKALGKVLFEQVCKQLNLLEADYFGLEYQDHSGARYWLDLEKQLSRQVGLTLVEPLLHFCVKFYTPDPAQLEEEYTRYLFCLQIKRDLAQGHIQCNDNTAALMASYIVQAECGDYNADDYPDASYLSTYKFVQHQDRELEKKIMENHKKHIGQSPAEADLNLLETARRCELYGMKMHPVKDHEGVPLNLAVAHMGIVVFQNYTKIYTFSWAKVRKISFKRKKFLIKLHPDGYGYYKDTVEFFFESRNECKNLWKKCVENHGFFRCNAVKRTPRQRTRVLSRGSSFRYSGKTQKQMVEFVRENYVKRQNFQRSQSFRQSSSVHSSVATNVGGSISAHPLIPLGDNSIVSVSCGSMVHVGEDSPSLTYRADPTIHRHSNHSRLLPQPPRQEQQGVQVSTTTAAITSFIPSTSTGLRSYNTTSSQTDIVDLVESSSTQTPQLPENQYMWHRSASAKELRKPCQQSSTDDSYMEPIVPPKSRNFAIAGSKTPSFDKDAETRVYSSSYPGTTSSLSTESPDELEPGGSVLVIDTGSSRDDISHDSYELLERDGRNYSRSCSVGSSGPDDRFSGPENQDDELFVMDDYRDFDDVDKRLGYVEPRYRNVGFNEFNELCKRGFASKRSTKPVEFDEFDAKCVPGAVIGHEVPEDRYPVERTKSEPYVSDFWRVAREHRKIIHQKSFDYTPTESIDSEASKSTADIPYTLHKRQQINGTCFECRSPVSPKPEDRPFERKPSFRGDRFAKTKHDSDLNSQDSGLSLSVGAESSDDLREKKSENTLSVKRDLLKVSSEDGPRHKSLLSKMKAVSADSGLRRVFSFERPPPVEVIKIPSQDGEGIVICSSDTKNFSLDTSDPDVIIVEYHTKRKRAFQKRSSSGGSDKTRSSGSSLDLAEKTKKEKHKEWKSDVKSASCEDKTDFKRERFSKEVKTSIEGKVVRESLEEKELKKQRSEELYRQKTEEFRKQKSEELTRQKSEEMQKKILRRQEVIEQLRQKHEDLNKIEVIKASKEEKKKTRNLQKPMVQKQDHVYRELSPQPTHKIIEVPVEINATEKQLGYCTCDHKSSTDKMEDIHEEKDSVFESVFEDDISKSNTPSLREIGEENVFSEPELVPEESKISNEKIAIIEPETNNEKEKSPIKSPHKSPAKSPQKSPVKSPQKSPVKSPHKSPVKSPQKSPKKSPQKETEEKPSVLDIKKSPDVEETAKQVVSPEMVWKKFGDLPQNKRERSPVLFARLGFSEGSVFPPTKAQSPASSRRAKSLDAPVVSLHRLPPVTSFSSKDDTVDNEEDIELEEKTIRKPISHNVIEEEDSANLSPLIQDSNRYMTTIEPMAQALPEIISILPDQENILETLEPSQLQSYNIELPPDTQIFSDEQRLPDIALLATERIKSPQLSDEQKVPDFPSYQDSDEPSEIQDEEYPNYPVRTQDIREDFSDLLEEFPEPEPEDSDEIFEGQAQPERRPSTRQERLDSFKNTKSYSVDIWTSEETEQPGIPTVDIEDVDWQQDDDAFAPDPVEAMMEQVSPKQKEFPGELYSVEDTEYDFQDMLEYNEQFPIQVDENDIPVNPSDIPIDLIPELPTIDVNETIDDDYIEENADIIPLSSLCERIVEPPPDLRVIPPKRSFDEDISSSSSLKPDKAALKPFSLESSGSSSLEEGMFPPDDSSHFADEEEGSSNSAKDEYQGFGYSVAGAELVIGGYTGGVFGLSRTLSRISERSTTSEQERSDFDDDLSTKPSSRSLSLEDESLMSSDRQPSLSSDPSIPEVEEQPLPPLPPEPLGFKIPPPLIQHDDEWPSPPNSSFDTPIISNVETFYMGPEEPTKVVIPKDYEDYSSDSEYESKTLQDDDGPDSSTKESTVKLALKPKKPGNSSDTSLGISDFSSSTSTVKHQYFTVKSDDSSLADFGSLSTEMLASSRKNSDDSMCIRRRSYHAIQKRSFDEYDSPYSESDESCPKQTKRYANLPSPTASCGKKKTKNQERRNVCSKSIARAKCYSYYSLARSPPSDGSSSSLEMGEPPSTPNTIPRVSKRRRHVPPSKRRHRIAEPDPHDGPSISVSSPSVACVKRPVRDRSQMSKQSSV